MFNFFSFYYQLCHLFCYALFPSLIVYFSSVEKKPTANSKIVSLGFGNPNQIDELRNDKLESDFNVCFMLYIFKLLGSDF